ncbi:MAG TPA: response regulator [Vicinamibacterales bacterium]|nr:response regulator [Vicinamibacterales bacterium]
MLLAALSPPTRSGRRLVVLLVEDHADTRQMYAEFLRPSFEVIQASDGQNALDAIRARKPDVLVTDISLPGMDGFQLIERMRQDPATRSIPVVCLSGHGGDVHEERARGAGARLIQKPCLPDALADTIIELLRRPDDAGSAS